MARNFQRYVASRSMVVMSGILHHNAGVRMGISERIEAG
jgi:hypothetical protein